MLQQQEPGSAGRLERTHLLFVSIFRLVAAVQDAISLCQLWINIFARRATCSSAAYVTHSMPRMGTRAKVVSKAECISCFWSLNPPRKLSKKALVSRDACKIPECSR